MCEGPDIAEESPTLTRPRQPQPKVTPENALQEKRERALQKPYLTHVSRLKLQGKAEKAQKAQKAEKAEKAEKAAKPADARKAAAQKARLISAVQGRILIRQIVETQVLAAMEEEMAPKQAREEREEEDEAMEDPPSCTLMDSPLTERMRIKDGPRRWRLFPTLSSSCWAPLSWEPGICYPQGNAGHHQMHLVP